MNLATKSKNFVMTALNYRVLPFFTFKFVLLIALLVIFFRFLGGQFDGSFLSTLIRIVLYYLVIDLLATYISRFIVFAYKKENKKSKDYVDNFILGIRGIFSVFGNFIFVFVVLYVLGVDLISLFTSLSIIAVALVLTFKEYITNFLSALFILFSDKYQLKDYVEVNNFKGRITDITFQNVVLKTDSKNYVYVPNSLFVSSGVINYSKESIKTIKVEFVVDQKRYTTFPKLEKDLKKFVTKNFSEIVPKEENVALKVSTIEKDNAKWTLEVYTSKYTFKDEEEIKFKVMEEVLSFLAKK